MAQVQRALKPDGVFLAALFGGATLGETGGWELFLSPGLFATYRNVALRTGVQIPIAERLNGNQPTSDYRFKAELKYIF